MPFFPRAAMTLTAIALTTGAIAACSHQSYQTDMTSSTSSSSTHYNSQQMAMATPDADMQKVLDAQASLKPKPIETLTAAQARLQPTPADGVKKIMRQMGKNPNASMGIMTKNIMVSGGAGTIPARLYWPKDAKKSDKPLPVVVYYHGGGWVIATNDTYDATPRSLSKQLNALVVSVEYRKAPEHKFPAAHDDAFAVYKWTLKNAGKYHGNSGKIALVGESAGGNLAINTAIKARDAGIQMPGYEALIYPVAGVDMNTPSYIENANAKPLNKAMMGWFVKNTIRTPADKTDPRLDIVGRADLRDLPPTTIITAQIDPLRSDGEMLADKLAKAGVPVEYESYNGVTHEFFGMAPLVGNAKDAQFIVVRDLTKALDL